MPNLVCLLACEIANESDTDFESRPIPDVAVEFSKWVIGKCRPRDRWASVIGRLLLLEALRTLGARDISLRDLGRRDDNSPTVPHPFCGSISHTAEMVVAVAAPSGSIGIDIESDKLAPLHSNRICTFFSDNEQLQLKDQNEFMMFTYLWTRKEALVKATGRSLDEVLRQSVLRDRVFLDGRLWHLRSRCLSLAHHCAIAWDRRPLQLHFRMLNFSTLAP